MMGSIVWRNEMNIGQLLVYAQRNKVMTREASDFPGCHFPYDSVAVSSGDGRFAMQVHDHDTGMSVRGYILGAGAPYRFFNGTYWKRSGYDHNPFRHEKGAWDSAFNAFISELVSLVEMDKQKKSAAAVAAKADAAICAETEKSSVEALFKAC